MNENNTPSLKISSDSYIGFRLAQLLYFAGTIIVIAFSALSFFYFDGQKYDNEQREKIKTDSSTARDVMRMQIDKDRLYILEKIDQVMKRIDERYVQLEKKIDKNSEQIEKIKIKKVDWDSKDNWQFIPHAKKQVN